MSIEENLERIAKALEKIANKDDTYFGTEEEAPEPSASGGKKAVRKKRATKKKKDEEPTGPAREDIQKALVKFCKDGPGKAAAKEVLEEFKAGSISTLDSKNYGAFLARLKEVTAAAA